MIHFVAHVARRFVAPVPPPCRRARAAEPEVGVDDDTPAGCGWFDSSHALRAGLVVVEHASADAVAGHLPLNDWLALHLGGAPGPVQA